MCVSVCVCVRGGGSVLDEHIACAEAATLRFVQCACVEQRPRVSEQRGSERRDLGLEF